MEKLNRTFLLSVETGDGDHITITDPLTIEFTVVRNSMASANTGSFRIYNLAEATRNQIFKDRYDVYNYRAIQLRAGYGDIRPLIFNGNYTEAYSYRQGPDIITEITALDGGFAMKNSMSSQTFAAGTPKAEVIDTLSKDMLKMSGAAIIGTITGTIKRGETILGPTYATIREKTNNACFIDLGVLNILNTDEVVQGEVHLINADTGIIGTPRRAKAQLEVETIFEPRIKVGQAVALQSAITPIYNGTYQVVGIEHSGTISKAVSGTLSTRLTLFLGTMKLITRLPPVTRPTTSTTNIA